MYGYRGNNQIRNFILTFLAGWFFGQIFTVNIKENPFTGGEAIIQKTVGRVK